MSLEKLGPRICIMGPSNSGKSTLAHAIGRARDLPVVHLDQLFHQPGTDWRPRPEAEFIVLHDAAIQAERWVMEGNYSRCLTQRLARATGFILLDIPTATGLFRYLRRSWFEQDRRGALEGGSDSVKWEMIHHIAVTTRANRRKYREMFERIDLPKIKLMTLREQARFSRAAGLDR
jgi:adenylate kinase family enzyme